MDVAGAKAGQTSAANTKANQPAGTNNSGKNVTDDQPINQRFRNLDDYLVHLEQMEGPVGGPWYKQVRPGIYELQTGNLRLDGEAAEQRTFTREQLARKFGFSR